MGLIRNAAYLPLISLAPRTFDAVRGSVIPSGGSDRSLASGLSGDFARHLLGSLLYTRAATVVTVNRGPGSTALVAEPVGRNAPVTVRVTYFYRCSVPVVRSLVCRSLQRLFSGESREPSERPGGEWARLEQRFELAEEPGRLRELAHDAYSQGHRGGSHAPEPGRRVLRLRTRGGAVMPPLPFCLKRDDQGAILLVAVFFAVFAVAILYSLIATAEAVTFREALQDRADRMALPRASCTRAP